MSAYQFQDPIPISLYPHGTHSCCSEVRIFARYIGVADKIPPIGMALSRIGLWMFDLAQLQILQESLELHPRRNRLTSFQYTLQVRNYTLSAHGCHLI